MVVARREDHHAALHRAVCALIAFLVTTGILDEIINGRLIVGINPVSERFFLCVIDIAPAVVHYDRAVIGGVDNRYRGVAPDILIRVGRILPKDAAREDTDAALAVQAAGDAADTDTVVADGANGTGHVRAVILGVDGIALIARDKTLAAVLARRDHHGGEVRMVHLDTAVHHGHNHIGGAAGEAGPDRLYINIAASYSIATKNRRGTIVIESPLLGRLGIIEIGLRTDPAGRRSGKHAVQRREIHVWLHFAFSRQSFRIRMDIKQSANFEPLGEHPAATRRQNPCARRHLPRVSQMPKHKQLLAAPGKYAAYPAPRPRLNLARDLDAAV